MEHELERQRSWGRVAGEAVLIVASILLAFGIDAWWDGMQDRRLEREYLQRLFDDLKANTAVVANLNRQQVNQIANARRLYPLVTRGEWDGLDTASAVISSYRASPTPSPTWVDDTFEELKSTGNLELLRTSELRSALLDFYRYLEGADYTYELMSTAYRDAIRERMDPDLQLTIRRCDPSDCRLDVASPGLSEYVAWLSMNSQLANGLRRVIVQWTRAEEEYLPGVQERIDEITAIIENELAR